MQIHELPGFAGTPENDYQFAMDSGTNTYAIRFAALGDAIITAATFTISGVAQTVKAAIEALQTEVNGKLSKSGDETLGLTGSVPRVSVVAANVASRFVASNTSNLTGLWDEKKSNWIISRNTSGVTHLPGYWTFTTASSSSTHYQQIIKNADGLMIINMRVTVNVAINSSSGGIYYGTATLPDFSQAFSEKPTVTYSTESGGSGIGNCWIWGRTAPSTTNPGGVYLGRGGSTAANNYIINVHAIGRV